MAKDIKSAGKANQSKSKREQFTKDKDSSRSTYIMAALAVVLVIVAAGFYMTTRGSGTVKADPQEAKYIGRFLPAGYQPAKLTEPITYDKTVEMTDITPQVKDGDIRINVGDVISNRIVYFEYTRPSDKQIIPMLAYIRPSGKLFTGISLCPPCQGKRQHFEADGTLTCNACGTKRDPETQVGISGACRLYPLDEIAHKVQGDKIVISGADLAKWTPQPIDRPVG